MVIFLKQFVFYLNFSINYENSLVVIYIPSKTNSLKYLTKINQLFSKLKKNLSFKHSTQTLQLLPIASRNISSSVSIIPLIFIINEPNNKFSNQKPFFTVGTKLVTDGCKIYTLSLLLFLVF